MFVPSMAASNVSSQAPWTARLTRTQLGLGVAFAVFVLVWMVTLGSRSLIHADEGRYATLALAMATTGDWITPRLNGLLYFEKPALQYWIGALSFRAFGINEFAARLWPGLAGLLTVLTVGETARRLWGRAAGVRAIAIAGSTTWIIGNSHFLTLDAGLSFFLTLVLCSMLLAECSGAAPVQRRRWVWLAWVAMAAAVLSKGLVGIVIPTGTLLLWSVWQRDFGPWRRLHWLSGMALFLWVATPWFVVVSLRNPDFAEFFFIHEHFARYLSKVHHREGAWWYYLPLLLVGSLPWTSGLPWLARRNSGDTANDTRAQRLLVSWSAFVLMFFSLSGSKLPSYILPMFSALALLSTLQLRSSNAAVLRRHLGAPTLVWLLLLAAATQPARYAAANGSSVDIARALAAGVAMGAALYFVGAALAWWCLRREQLTAALVCVALSHFAGMTAVMQSHDFHGQLKSADAIAAVLLPQIDDRTPVFALRSYDQTLPFYLRRNVILVDFIDEFAFGQQHEPDKSIATLDEFLARWNALPQGALYLPRNALEALRARGAPMRVVFEDARRLVVMRR